ncbi:MAG TPA: hypothetical protein VMT03_19960 [Polyangia bacterium]|nr:hypothetical protein [Polyangia bacterium]
MRAPSLVILLAAALTGVACSSHSDEVCQDIGDCSQGGSNDWIATCQANAKALGDESNRVGCGTAFDQYFACADSAYSCQGATATFPGCDQDLATLDACLAAATADTWCVKLQTAEAACTTVAPAGGPPQACTSLRDCQAACYLGNVASACAPQIDELQSLVACSQACPP